MYLLYLTCVYNAKKRHNYHRLQHPLQLNCPDAFWRESVAYFSYLPISRAGLGISVLLLPKCAFSTRARPPWVFPKPHLALPHQPCKLCASANRTMRSLGWEKDKPNGFGLGTFE